MTHRELLQKLPSPIREQAIENNTAEYLASSEYQQLYEVLGYGFIFAYFLQRVDYWKSIYLRAKAGVLEATWQKNKLTAKNLHK
jgi:hypothetical protein